MPPKQIYLTIDDSPSKQFRTNLDYLIAHDIPCVFFCIGQQIETAWEDLKYAIRQGYSIGNHSFTHPYFSEITLEKAKDEIFQTDILIKRLYWECGIYTYPKYFRFPYGDKGDGKYGLVFSSIEEARKQKPTPRWKRFFHSKNIGSAPHAEAIQSYLSTLGYTSAQLANIHYPFFKKLQKDIDWSWTFDVEEWRYTGKERYQFLLQMKARLENPFPKDARGKDVVSGSLCNTESADLVLFHDRAETNVLFRSILDMMREMQVEFLPFAKV